MSTAFQTFGGFILFMILIAGSHAPAVGSGTTGNVENVRTHVSTGSLPAPKEIAATPRTGAVTLTWKSVPGCTGYRVYWAKKGNVTRTQAQLMEVSSQELSCTVESLIAGVSYGFKVCAVKSCKEGTLSNQVVAAPLGVTQILQNAGKSLALEKASEGDWIDRSTTGQVSESSYPPPPGSLKVTPQVEGVLLQWKPVKGSTGYRIYWERAGHVTDCSNWIADLPADQTFYHLGDLSSGTLYYFRVCTLNASTKGPLSREFAVKPKDNTKTRASDRAP